MLRIAIVLIISLTASALADGATKFCAAARTAQAQGKWSEAATFYDEVFENNPTQKLKAQALLGLVECNLQMGKHRDAIALVSRLFSECKDRPDELKKGVNLFLKARKVLQLREQHRQSRKSDDLPVYATGHRYTGEAPREARVWAKLDGIVIKKATFKNEPAWSAFSKLAELSKRHDPAGKGASILFDEPRRAGQKTHRYPITMDFENIPLGDAIRYACEQARLRYRIDGNVVRVFSPAVATKPHELKFISTYLGEDILREYMPKGIQKYVADKGVTFPTDPLGRRACVWYNKLYGQLGSLNTAENNHLLNRILGPHDCPSPPTLRLSYNLVQLIDPPKVFDRINGAVTAEMFLALSTRNRRLISTTAVCNNTGNSFCATDRFGGLLGNEHKQFHSCIFANLECGMQGRNVGLDLSWRVSAFADNRALSRYEGYGRPEPGWNKEVRVDLGAEDGEPVAVRLDSSDAGGNDLFLLIKVEAIGSDGKLLRPHRRGELRTRVEALKLLFTNPFEQTPQ